MQTKQGRTLQSLRVVQSFLDANAANLANVVQSGIRKQLDYIVAALEEHADVQSGSNYSAQSATQKHYSLRTVLLRDHMAPVAKIAEAQLPDSPEMEPLRMPRGRPSVDVLKALAVGMANAAEPHKDMFLAAGLPADFIEQLKSAAKAVVDSVGQRKANRITRGGATKGIRTLASRGRSIVHALDAMVKSALKGDLPMLREWNIAKRVERYTKPAVLAAPTPQPPAPTPAPTPAPAA